MPGITNGLLVVDVVPLEEEDESPFVRAASGRGRGRNGI
jgi:hypothetical protein